MAAALQKFCLKWNDYRHSVTEAFEGLRQDEELVDMTLCCEGKKIKAHRMMLSACSPFFRELLKENPCPHPVFLLRDVSYRDLWSAIEFVYRGEVNVRQADLASFLKTAEMLQLRGLTEDDAKGAPSEASNGSQSAASTSSPSPRPVSSAAGRRTSGGSSWEHEPAEPSPRPAKRARSSTASAAAPPPPPPPPAPVPAPMAEVKSEPPPPPPPHLYDLDEESAYSGKEEHDPALQTILYHGMSPDPPEMGLDPDERTSDSVGSLQLLEAHAAAGGGRRAGPGGGGGRGDGRSIFPCETCGREYSTRNALGKHRKVHLGETTCHTCCKVFSSKWRLQNHFKISSCLPG